MERTNENAVSALLRGLPNNGNFARKKVISPSSSRSHSSVLHTVIPTTSTAPPRSQVIKTDQTNILVRALRIRKQQERDKRKTLDRGYGGGSSCSTPHAAARKRVAVEIGSSNTKSIDGTKASSETLRPLSPHAANPANASANKRKRGRDAQEDDARDAESSSGSSGTAPEPESQRVRLGNRDESPVQDADDEDDVESEREGEQTASGGQQVSHARGSRNSSRRGGRNEAGYTTSAAAVSRDRNEYAGDGDQDSDDDDDEEEEDEMVILSQQGQNSERPTTTTTTTTARGQPMPVVTTTLNHPETDPGDMNQQRHASSSSSSSVPRCRSPRLGASRVNSPPPTSTQGRPSSPLDTAAA
jgi:hypothetical protein